MMNDTTLPENFCLDLLKNAPKWPSIPDTFVGIRDSSLVVDDYVFTLADTTSIPWDPDVFKISYNRAENDFIANTTQDACITDTLVNDNKGNNFTVVSLYNKCVATAYGRPWVFGNSEDQGSYYGIIPAISTLVDTYNVTSLFSIPTQIKSSEEGEDEGLSGGSSILDAKLCPISSVADALTSSDGSISINSIYEITVKNEQGQSETRWVELTDTQYFEKLPDGRYRAKFDSDDCIKSKADLTTTGSKVSISTDNCASDDIPGFLDQKLVSYDEQIDFTENGSEQSEDITNLGVVFQTSTRIAPCSNSDKPVEHQVMVGHVEVPSHLFSSGMVAIQGCEDNDIDIPHYLNNKLLVSDDEGAVPMTLNKIAVNTPCGGTDKMYALQLSLAKEDVYPTLDLGPLSSIFSTNAEEGPQQNIKLEDVVDGKGYLVKKENGWFIDPSINPYKPGLGIKFDLNTFDGYTYIKTYLLPGINITLEEDDKGYIEIHCPIGAGNCIYIDKDQKLQLSHDDTLAINNEGELTVIGGGLDLEKIAGNGLVYNRTNGTLDINYGQGLSIVNDELIRTSSSNYTIEGKGCITVSNGTQFADGSYGTPVIELNYDAATLSVKDGKLAAAKTNVTGTGVLVQESTSGIDKTFNIQLKAGRGIEIKNGVISCTLSTSYVPTMDEIYAAMVSRASSC